MNEQVREELGSEENQAVLRRRGKRRATGQDTPSGPNTDRTVIPAKRERDEIEAEESETDDQKKAGPV